MLLLFSGCPETEAPPNGNAKVSWYINWSQSPNNSLEVQGGGPDVWKTALEQETNYSVSPIRQAAVQQEPDLIWNDIGRFEVLINAFYQQNGIDSKYPSAKNSFLLGIGTPLNSPDTILGITYPWGTIGDPQFAFSFVFKSRIDTLTFPDTANTSGKRLWSITRVALHECGHGRGLNWGDADYEHTNHGGLGSAECIMNDLILTLEPQVFCKKHQKILRECLTEIKGSYYRFDECALYP